MKFLIGHKCLCLTVYYSPLSVVLQRYVKLKDKICMYIVLILTEVRLRLASS